MALQKKRNNRIASVISNAADNLSWSESHVMTVRDPTYVCNSMVIVANEGVLFVCVCVCVPRKQWAEAQLGANQSIYQWLSYWLALRSVKHESGSPARCFSVAPPPKRALKEEKLRRERANKERKGVHAETKRARVSSLNKSLVA